MIERRRLKSPQVVSLAEALTQAAPFTQTIDEVKAALADISYESVTLGQTQWEHVGAAVWAATGGSEEGLAAFDEWSKPWFYYTPEAARTRWNNCAASPPSIGADALLRMAKQAREIKTKRAEADAERIAELAKKDKLEYDRERKAAAKGLGITRVKTLDKLVEEKRREKAPPPPPPKIDIDKLKEAAKPILDSEDVLAKFAEAIRPRLAGEVANAKLLYLIYTTRYFAKPMNTAVKGLSAIGKSHLADRVLDFIPRESVVAFTTLSEKALYFLPEDLAHKILRMAEAVGSKEESLQDYLMREMISNHRITHRTTVKDPDTGQMVGHVIEREGPICFVTTTTKGKLHPEIENSHSHAGDRRHRGADRENIGEDCRDRRWAGRGRGRLQAVARFPVIVGDWRAPGGHPVCEGAGAQYRA